MPRPLSLSFGLTFDEALQAAEERYATMPGDYYGALQASTRRVAFTASNLAALDQVQAVMDSLTAAIAEGQSLREWQQAANDQEWGLPASRLETIYRTNVQTSYMAGHWREFQDNAQNQPYLMYSAINDSRTRPAHAAMSGYIAGMDDPIWSEWTPPCGYNCRCTLIALTQNQAEARGLGTRVRPNVQPDEGFGGHPLDVQRTIDDAMAEASAGSDQSFVQRIGANLSRYWREILSGR